MPKQDRTAAKEHQSHSETCWCSILGWSAFPFFFAKSKCAMPKVTYPKRKAFVSELLLVIILDLLISKTRHFNFIWNSQKCLKFCYCRLLRLEFYPWPDIYDLLLLSLLFFRNRFHLNIFEQVPDFLVRTTAVTVPTMRSTKSPTQTLVTTSCRLVRQPR